MTEGATSSVPTLPFLPAAPPDATPASTGVLFVLLCLYDVVSGAIWETPRGCDPTACQGARDPSLVPELRHRTPRTPTAFGGSDIFSLNGHNVCSKMRLKIKSPNMSQFALLVVMEEDSGAASGGGKQVRTAGLEGGQVPVASTWRAALAGQPRERGPEVAGQLQLLCDFPPAQSAPTTLPPVLEENGRSPPC